MKLVEMIRRAREVGSFESVTACIPYMQFMGMTASVVDGDVVTRLGFAPHLVGNPQIPAIHGGVIGALLESAAIFKLVWSTESVTIPKTINVTVQFLRSAAATDTFARAQFVRHGRRIATVSACAWQDDESTPVAQASMHFLLGVDPAAGHAVS